MRLEACESCPPDWSILAIEDVCRRITSGGTPSRKSPEYFVGGDILWVKTQELLDEYIRDTEEKITPEAVLNSSAKVLPRHTILMAMYGATVGQLGILDREATCNQASCALIVDPDKADFRYLYFQLKVHRTQIKSLSTGAAQQNLSGAQIRQFQLPFPGLEEQRQIASILSALDDKIALLRETNSTLEAIAQALFKSWFVDFDPVRAKAEKRDPEGVTPEIADLFPSEFEGSELGAVPKGWRVSNLEEHLDVVRGLSYKGSGLTDSTDPEGVPMHNLNSVLEGGGYKYAGLKYYNGEFKEKHQIKSGDLIVANTEQGHKHLLIGFPAIVPARIGKVGLFSHHLYRIRPSTNSPVRSQFIYRLLLTTAVREQVIGCANGTTVNMLKADGLSKPRFVCPPATLIQAFDELALSFQQKQESNVTQAESLSDLRDTLLPRLMSGKLRIPNKEEIPV